MLRLREALTRLVAGRTPLPEQTKASLTGPLLTLQTLGQPVWAPRDYGTFAREGYAQNAILHRCVRMTAEACASIPLLLYERGQEIEEHPLLDLMRRPSPGMTGVDLLERWYGFLLVAGNAYMEAVALDGEVRELHALRPDRMKVVPGPDGWPEAWEYEVAGRSVRFAGEVADGVRPILHLKLFHPGNDHYGLSPIEAAATAVDIHNEASRWNKALLDNSARPSGALVYAAANGQMTGEQFERLKRELESTYQGAKHAGRPLLLEGGLDWKPLSLSPKDMDFVESKNAAAREIALALGVPPMLLGIPGDNTYAADWAEYFGHQPQDGTGDVYFHLDPLWSSAAIDAVGIDVYWPLADWREGRTHLDYLAGYRSSHDLAYLKANITGGEGFDWYYASQGDRIAQVRTPITDGLGKPWVFRFKDIRGWWQSQHFNRPGGSEAATPTAWLPQSKPLWFLEIGCPAVDKGANQPNVFVDVKSSENALPHFSRGTRDDLIQRRLVQALYEAFDPADPDYVTDTNPISLVYGGTMVALDRMYVYAWDARPFPTFPSDDATWGDAQNWRLGHWLNGRASSAALDRLVARLLRDFGFEDFEPGALTGTVAGYVVDRIMSARDALQPLELAYFFDGLESGGAIHFRHRGAEAVAASLTEADLVEEKPAAALLALTRGQETELPATAKISYVGADQDYRQAVADARRLTGRSARVAQAELPLVLDDFQAAAMAEAFLFEAWASRERAQLTLPPSLIGIEPGDVLEVDVAGEARLFRVTGIGDHGAREVEARSIDPDIYGLGRSTVRPGRGGDGAFVGQPLAVFLDLPMLRSDEPAEAGYVAAIQSPWPGGIAFYRSPETTGYALKAIASAPAVIGTTLDALSAGPVGRIDRANRLRVRIEGGELVSVTRLQLLAGQNVAAVETAPGYWELIQFEIATLVASRTYELSGLLRAQAGTDPEMAALLPAGARFVLVDGALARVGLTLDDINLPFNWKAGPSRRDIGDPSYITRVHTFRGRGLLPLSPVHIRAARDGTGNIQLSWVRRTRIGGDTWETPEVPLGESSERYEVDILDGTIVRRTLAASAASVAYSAAEQVADFGAPTAALTVRVHQVSETVGRGSGRTAIV
jgi:HK97 family phage portal protein